MYSQHINKQKLNQYRLISISREVGIRQGKAIGVDSHHLSRLKWRGPSTPFRRISLAIYSPRHTFKRYHRQGQGTYELGNIHLSPKLSIYAGQRKYFLEVNQLSSEEHLWISTELNDFVGIPLQAIAPTEKGTPAQNRLAKISK